MPPGRHRRKEQDQDPLSHTGSSAHLPRILGSPRLGAVTPVWVTERSLRTRDASWGCQPVAWQEAVSTASPSCPAPALCQRIRPPETSSGWLGTHGSWIPARQGGLGEQGCWQIRRPELRTLPQASPETARWALGGGPSSLQAPGPQHSLRLGYGVNNSGHRVSVMKY